ncbi:hypothetical protein HDU86_001489 [Geranomyces michiganensis]|nr:hypothetical protein HDU86_001489 [Geranomyces michiganensis]
MAASAIYDPASGDMSATRGPASTASTASFSSDDTPLATLAQKHNNNGGIAPSSSTLQKSPSEDSMSTLYEMDAGESVYENAESEDEDDDDDDDDEEEDRFPQRPKRQASSSSGVGAELRNAFLAGRMREGDAMEEEEEGEQERKLVMVEEEKVVQVADIAQKQEDDDSLPADDVVHAPVEDEFVDAQEGIAGDEQSTAAVSAAPVTAIKAEHEAELPSTEPQERLHPTDVPIASGNESVPKAAVAQPSVEAQDSQENNTAAALIAPATVAPSATAAPTAKAPVVPKPQSDKPEQSKDFQHKQFGKSVSEISLPRAAAPAPAPAATTTPANFSAAAAAKPRGLQMSHSNQSAPALGRSAKTAPTKKPKSRFANCFSWLPGVSSAKKDASSSAKTRAAPPGPTAAAPAPPVIATAAIKTEAPIITKLKSQPPVAHTLTEKRSIASFMSGKKTPSPSSLLHAPGAAVVNASVGKPPFMPGPGSAAGSAARSSTSSFSPAPPRGDSLSAGAAAQTSTPPRDTDSMSGSESVSSERRSIFRGGRNASRERMADYRFNSNTAATSNSNNNNGGDGIVRNGAPSLRKGSVSTASQRTAPLSSEQHADEQQARAHDDTVNKDERQQQDAQKDSDVDEDAAAADSRSSAEVYTLHSRASQMTLSLPEMPKLGDLDVVIPPAPGRTEVPYHSSVLPPAITPTARAAAAPRASSSSAEQEENEKLEMLRAVVGDSTRHVKESAAAHRRRWDEELQGSDTSGGRSGAAVSTTTTMAAADSNPTVGSIRSVAKSSMDQQQARSASVRSSLLYDGLSRSASSVTAKAEAAAAAAPPPTGVLTPPATPASTASVAPARLTSPSRLFLNQDFQQGAFASSPFSSSFTSLSSAGGRSGAAAAAAAAAATTGGGQPAGAASGGGATPQLDPLEKLYHDICNSGMDLDQLAGKYDANATRRPTAKRSGSAGARAANGGPVPAMPQTPPRSVVGGGTAPAAAAAEHDAYAGNNAIDGWRKNIARALESTHSASRSVGGATAAAAPLSPPPSPAAPHHHHHHHYFHNNNNSSSSNHSQVLLSTDQPAASTGIRQKALVSRRTAAGTGAAPRANVDERAVWSLHEDFVAALDGTDGDPNNDLAGVVGFALAMHDGQA